METTATTKGQIVIPSSVRRKLDIREGTRIKVEVDEEGHRIILKPITRRSIAVLRGILKGKRGGKSATQELLEERARDLKREEAKLARHRSR